MTTVVGERREVIEEELEAEYAGVGWWGSLYRAPRRRRWYRLIPVEEISGEQRSELLAWQTRPRRPDLVPVVPGERGEQRQFADRWYQIVCYETDAERSLADAVAEPEPTRRLASVADVIRALPGWREAMGTGLVPLPADTVLAGHRPLLLPLPAWGSPSLGQVFAEPERVAHLTPEAVRGLPSGGRAPDLYALGVAALRCFGTLPYDDTERLLQRTSCAAVFGDQRRDGRLPSWMRRVEPVRKVLQQLCDLTGPRAAGSGDADPWQLADALDQARRAMDPLTAVRSLRAAGEPRKAVGLAHAALVDQPGSPLLLLAAEIAHQDLGEPLEALSLLERAVQADPERSQAYAAQLSIIGGLWSVVQGRLAGATNGSFAHRLHATARAAFDRLPPESRREHAHEMARCLIGQGELVEASAFVHHWLHDGDTLMWWRFDLMLDYAETFLRLGRLEAAAQIADQVKAGLRRIRESGRMDRRDIHEHGMRYADFVRDLHEARGGETGT
ncbi:tetratricopeptide repeat-containing serine/threonine-protein kinase [Streptomyces sp. NBC_01142]|uniref:protein kinase family protein n=1 Tax=Streptomyces sp. NBC_01142 TaxID=2975865 RepID=UPI0022570259|nr:protein kinase family protein [Streptomyces sp. NBC_01142]MCX4820098.1 tetratricopeptide repeat-containing serine/threonine-protein kinase [Streptomyces sp. NBC_01142]